MQGLMKDLIDEWKKDFKGYIDALDIHRDDYNGIMEYIDEVPSAQPDRYTIDCILYNLYNQLSNRCGTGAMVGCKDWIEQLYEEIFGKGMRPVWMT